MVKPEDLVGYENVAQTISKLEKALDILAGVVTKTTPTGLCPEQWKQWALQRAEDGE